VTKTHITEKDSKKYSILLLFLVTSSSLLVTKARKYRMKFTKTAAAQVQNRRSAGIGLLSRLNAVMGIGVVPRR